MNILIRELIFLASKLLKQALWISVRLISHISVQSPWRSVVLMYLYVESCRWELSSHHWYRYSRRQVDPLLCPSWNHRGAPYTSTSAAWGRTRSGWRGNERWGKCERQRCIRHENRRSNDSEILIITRRLFYETYVFSANHQKMCQIMAAIFSNHLTALLESVHY